MSADREPASGRQGLPRAEVAACSSAAAAQGIRVGMPLAEAQALAPELAIVPHEPPRDREALEKLAEACERFSPCVGLEEGDEPESLLLDISNLEHLWGSEARLAKRVETFFTRRGYRVRLAVADTLGAAWALAHFGGVACSRAAQRSVSMSSRSMPSPSMLTLLRDESMAPNQRQLPVEALRIASDTAATLRQLGVETIGQLLILPREGLASRFGDELLRRIDQLTGAAREVIVPHRPLAALEISRALEEPTAARAALAHVLGELLEELSRQLAARDQGAVLLMCLLRCVGSNTAPGNTVPLRVGLLQPSANARQLMELIDLHLETVRLADKVDRVELRVAVAGRLGERQGQLFADRWPSDPHQVAVLVNRLSSRLGYEQVLRAELRKSPVPERAVGWKPVTESRVESQESRARRLRWVACSRAAQRSVSMPARNMLTLLRSERMPPRPLLLHPAPQPLEVVCIAPDGPPQFVWLENRRERIVHCAGPERIETLWWRGPSVRRDYYRVALESGSHLWIFRRLTDRRWFLHGIFA